MLHERCNAVASGANTSLNGQRFKTTALTSAKINEHKYLVKPLKAYYKSKLDVGYALYARFPRRWLKNSELRPIPKPDIFAHTNMDVHFFYESETVPSALFSTKIDP